MSSRPVRIGIDRAKQLQGEAERLAVADTYVADAAIELLMKLPARERDRAIRDAANRRRRRAS